MGLVSMGLSKTPSPIHRNPIGVTWESGLLGLILIYLFIYYISYIYD